MKQKVISREGDLYDPYSRTFHPDGLIVDTDDYYWARAMRDGTVAVAQTPKQEPKLNTKT